VKASGDSTYRRGKGEREDGDGDWEKEEERRGTHLMVPITTWECFSASDFLSVPRNQLKETAIHKARVASAMLVE